MTCSQMLQFASLILTIHRYGWQNKNQIKTKSVKKNYVYNMRKNKIFTTTSKILYYDYVTFVVLYTLFINYICISRALLSKESKDKLSVNFMYEPPPGAKKEREREDNEPEYKFEWQRKFNAPREE